MIDYSIPELAIYKSMIGNQENFPKALDMARTAINLPLHISYKKSDLVKKVLQVLNKPFNLIKFVKDRPGHDFRYSIDSSKLKRLVNIKYKNIDEGLKDTIEWYK